MMSSEDVQLIFIPGPGMGHIVSAIEVGKLILNKETRLSITYLLIKDAAVDQYTNSTRFKSHPRLKLLNLPQLREPLETKSELASIRSVERIDRHKPLVREAVLRIMATGTRVIGLVVDMFCTLMIDVAHELSIPTYVFFTSGAGFLSIMLFMQTLKDLDGVDITAFQDSDREFSVAGFLNPVPAKVLPSAMLDKSGGSDVVMSTVRRIRKSRGIFINTFQELEPHIIHSLSCWAIAINFNIN